MHIWNKRRSIWLSMTLWSLHQFPQIQAGLFAGALTVSRPRQSSCHSQRGLISRGAWSWGCSLSARCSVGAFQLGMLLYRINAQIKTTTYVNTITTTIIMAEVGAVTASFSVTISESLPLFPTEMTPWLPTTWLHPAVFKLGKEWLFPLTLKRSVIRQKGII